MYSMFTNTRLKCAAVARQVIVSRNWGLSGVHICYSQCLHCPPTLPDPLPVSILHGPLFHKQLTAGAPLVVWLTLGDCFLQCNVKLYSVIVQTVVHSCWKCFRNDWFVILFAHLPAKNEKCKNCSTCHYRGREGRDEGGGCYV